MFWGGKNRWQGKVGIETKRPRQKWGRQRKGELMMEHGRLRKGSHTERKTEKRKDGKEGARQVRPMSASSGPATLSLPCTQTSLLDEMTGTFAFIHFIWGPATATGSESCSSNHPAGVNHQLKLSHESPWYPILNSSSKKEMTGLDFLSFSTKEKRTLKNIW